MAVGERRRSRPSHPSITSLRDVGWKRSAIGRGDAMKENVWVQFSE